MADPSCREVLNRRTSLQRPLSFEAMYSGSGIFFRKRWDVLNIVERGQCFGFIVAEDPMRLVG